METDSYLGFIPVMPGTGSVYVMVEDENDVLPKFSSSFWHVEVEERINEGEVVALLTLEDEDISNDFHYRVSLN